MENDSSAWYRGARRAATNGYCPPLLSKIGDISKMHGGEWDHDSHQNGLDVDVRYVRNDEEEGQLDIITSPSLYDQEATQALVNLFLDEGAVTIYAHNASGLIGITHDPEHTNHFHVRFADPDGLDN